MGSVYIDPATDLLDSSSIERGKISQAIYKNTAYPVKRYFRNSEIFK